jgi:hypothetical protein
VSTGTATEWDVAVGSGLLRLAAGAALLRFRGRAITWSGGDPKDPALRALFTYWGVRDLTVGLSTLTATRPGRDVPRQVMVQAAADASDGGLVIAAMSRGLFPRTRGIGLVGLCWGTAAADLAVAWRLKRGL